MRWFPLLLLLTGCLPDSISILLTGQSNCSGRGLQSQEPALVNPENVWVLRNDDILDQPPLHVSVDDATDQVDGISRDVAAGGSFARHLADEIVTDIRRPLDVVLVPAARGGTAAWQWAPSTSRGTLAGSSLRRGRVAVHTAGTELAVIVHYQGESNSANIQAAAQWEPNTRALFDFWRQEWPDVGIVIVQLPSQHQASRLGWDAVRAAQASLAASYPKTLLVAAPNSFIDPIHLDMAGQLELAELIADAINRARWLR